VRRVVILALGAVVAGGLAGCDLGQGEERKPATHPASSLAPPVINEKFTLLPCPPKPKTTRDFEGCAEERIVRTDRAINERAKAIFSRLRSRAAADRFVRGERAWLRYRQAACRSRADVYEGGSAAGVVFAECVATKNAAHLKELTAFERALRPK
jgi:uncharacterized protein YecT (DUF1311 family)